MGGSLERPGEVLGRPFGEHFGRARAEDQKYIKIMPFLVCGRRVFEDVFACSRTVCLERAGKAEVEKIIDFHYILQYFSHVRVLRAERRRRTNRGGRRSKSDPKTVRTPIREESLKNIKK